MMLFGNLLHAAVFNSLLLFGRVSSDLLKSSRFSICKEKVWNATSNIFTKIAIDPVECAALCTGMEACRAVNFEIEGECELFTRCVNTVVDCDGLESEAKTTVMYKSGVRGIDRNACPMHYIYDGNMGVCYRIFSNQQETYIDANKTCAAEVGGHLLRVNDMCVWQMISKKLSTSYSNLYNFFIDGTEEGHIGTWTNSDGSSKTWALWGGSEPNNAGETCMGLHRNVQYKFADVHCNTIDHFICQVD